jgi:hypothetical protein
VKKIIATILSVLYVLASSGATINFHYCMGKFIGWNVSATVNQKCNNCGMTKENKKGCCSDKQQTFQLKKDQLAASVNTIPGNTFHFAYAQYPSSTKSFTVVKITEVHSVHSPPELKTISPLILNCVFRI